MLHTFNYNFEKVLTKPKTKIQVPRQFRGGTDDLQLKESEKALSKGSLSTLEPFE